MAQEKTILVATVKHPGRRFRILETKFDEVNAAAEEAGKKSPFIEQEEGCEGGPSFDQLDAAGKKKVKVRQDKIQTGLDAAHKAADDEEEEE